VGWHIFAFPFHQCVPCFTVEVSELPESMLHWITRTASFLNEVSTGTSSCGQDALLTSTASECICVLFREAVGGNGLQFGHIAMLKVNTTAHQKWLTDHPSTSGTVPAVAVAMVSMDVDRKGVMEAYAV
jgi:hypothetical protein